MSVGLASSAATFIRGADSVDFLPKLKNIGVLDVLFSMSAPFKHTKRVSNRHYPGLHRQGYPGPQGVSDGVSWVLLARPSLCF